MLRFAIISHKSTTDFSLNGLPGGTGRMDVLRRCVNSSFFHSHDLKKRLSTPAESEFKIAGDGITIRLVGLAELSQEFSFVVLAQNGVDIRDAKTLPENIILSEHMNFTEEEEARLKDLPQYHVSPRVLHPYYTINGDLK